MIREMEEASGCGSKSFELYSKREQLTLGRLPANLTELFMIYPNPYCIVFGLECERWMMSLKEYKYKGSSFVFKGRFRYKFENSK